MIRLVFVCIMLALMAQGAYAEEAFSAGDRVQTTDILHVRGAPGTSSPEIDTMIKGAVGTVVEGPVSKEGYNWWNICYDLGTTGWSAENWLEKALTEPQQPSDFALWSENAIKWGEERNGRKDWWDETKKQGYCLRFVANAFMQEYVEGQSVWNSAIEAAATLYRFNQEPGGWTNAPRGAVILFDKEGKNNYGHVGIYLGEGQIIHAYGTVQSTTIESAMAYPDVGRYLGWSYPPDAWRPKTAGINQQTQTTQQNQETNVAIDEDISCLATALMSEASIGTYEERAAVAWTIFNRVESSNFPNSICGVVNQRGQYATNQEPTPELLDLAASLISDRGTDPTGGAVYFFSPIRMPKEGGATGGYDIGGGLHEVAGIDGKVYFPSFALTKEPVGEIPGVRPEYYMFYRDRATSDQVTLTLYVHDGSADGPVLSGAEVNGWDVEGRSFSQTTDANGLVVIMGKPGSWQFTATKAGYVVNSWSQDITETDTKHAFLQKEQPQEYARTNEYIDDSIALCDPGAISVSCTSPDACVDCNGECHSSGSNIGDGWICNQGRWSNALLSIVKNPDNGHYYRLVAQNLNWNDAKSYAETYQFVDPETGYIYKGHLATVTSPEESSWIMENTISSLSGQSKIWLGGYQDENKEGEPAGDWHWVTDEPWSWTNWNPGEPNDDNRDERYLELWGHADGHWNDEDVYHQKTKYLLVEYET